MFYTIQNGSILIADKKESLTRFYDCVNELPSDYEQEKYIVVDGELVLNPNFEEEKQAEEQQRIAMLSLTAADVERGIYKATGMDFDDIIAKVTEIATSDALAMTIDVKALKIELKANNFYRGNPYVDAVGSLLGFTKEQLDAFFETNDYTKLLPVEEPTEENQVEDNLDMVEE